MASSRGRERLRQKEAAGISYAFGSSTPRDFSYLSRVPRKFRQYDIKMPAGAQNGPSLMEYMRQERGGWAFGSSTPRDPSHITTGRRHESRSVTRPNVLSMTRSVTVEAPRNRTAQVPFITRRTQEEEGERDEVSSEPDLVQDRTLNLEEAKKKLIETQPETPTATKKPPKPAATNVANRNTGRNSPKRQKSSSSSRPQSRDQPSPTTTKKQTTLLNNREENENSDESKPEAWIKTELQGQVKATLITMQTNIEKPIGEEITVVQDVATEIRSNHLANKPKSHNVAVNNSRDTVNSSITEKRENLEDQENETSKQTPENHSDEDFSNDL
ncbi:unnamed protein product, partial [Mesorhabditis belari]|uniref:Uncharacterized protein n=1 Tax=Mesorhabditis belari TaxID=2138241 RepID=A0AAF3EBD7_9BILA